MSRILTEDQKIATRDAMRRFRAKQRGEAVAFSPAKRTANAGSFTSERLTKHGMYNTPEWRAWKDMKARCSNKRLKNYPRYGGRGIRVCAEWLNDFAAFFAHVGKRPSEAHSLERKNNDGNYEPGNVKWADSFEQMRNTRMNQFVEIDGRSQIISEWARERGVTHSVIRHRLQHMDPKEAIMGVGANA